MFGFSFAKIAVLIAIIAFVWFGFRFLARLEAGRAPGRLGRRRRRIKAAKTGEAPAEPMVECPTCGVFMPAADTNPCDRADCPY